MQVHELIAKLQYYAGEAEVHLEAFETVLEVRTVYGNNSEVRIEAGRNV